MLRNDFFPLEKCSEMFRKMNSIKNRVEEIILRELIYVWGDFTMEYTPKIL